LPSLNNHFKVGTIKYIWYRRIATDGGSHWGKRRGGLGYWQAALPNSPVLQQLLLVARSVAPDRPRSDDYFRSP